MGLPPRSPNIPVLRPLAAAMPPAATTQSSERANNLNVMSEEKTSVVFGSFVALTETLSNIVAMNIHVRSIFLNSLRPPSNSVSYREITYCAHLFLLLILPENTPIRLSVLDFICC